MGAYEKFAQVYDLFMDNIDYEEWADYITAVSYTHSPSPRDQRGSRMPSSA